MEKIQIKPIVFIFLFFLLNSCAVNVQQSDKRKGPSNIASIEEDPSILNKVSDIPIPSNSLVDKDKTFVIGSGEEWIGRLSLINNDKKNNIFDFFLKNMSNYSYKKKNIKENNVSTLIYENNKKVIFIKLLELKIEKTFIEITATPVN
ncbi:MAG: hypothetical protein CMI97_03895 [Pelagibacteraceae bacterium]|nr:hypothetical protein [Pelagibacteraceae bacterium]